MTFYPITSVHHHTPIWTVMTNCNRRETRKRIHDNIDSFVWFSVSKQHQQHFKNYTINSTVMEMYNRQNSWKENTREYLEKLARRFAKSSGAKGFRLFVKEYFTNEYEELEMLYVLYICAQLCAMYVAREELATVDLLIQQLKDALMASLTPTSPINDINSIV